MLQLHKTATKFLKKLDEDNPVYTTELFNRTKYGICIYKIVECNCHSATLRSSLLGVGVCINIPNRNDQACEKDGAHKFLRGTNESGNLDAVMTNGRKFIFLLKHSQNIRTTKRANVYRIRNVYRSLFVRFVNWLYTMSRSSFMGCRFVF